MGSWKSVPEAWISSMTAVPTKIESRLFIFAERSTTEAASFLSNVAWEDKPVEIREISRNLEKWETRCSSCCLRCLGHPATQCEQQLHCFGRRRTLWRTSGEGKKKKKNDARLSVKKKERYMYICFCVLSQERKSICSDWLIANICYCWQYCAREKWAFELWIPMRPFLIPGTIYCISYDQ